MGVFLLLLMINDLKTNAPTYKYVDDTTIYAITNNPDNMKFSVQWIQLCSGQWKMIWKLIKRKRKRCSSHSAKTHPWCHITVNGEPIDHVDCLTWGAHVNHIVSKAQKHLFSLNILKRSELSPQDIIQMYSSWIRPILEYASPAWHAGLTDEQSDALEQEQRRALKIAYPNLDYEDACQTGNIPILKAIE